MTGRVQNAATGQYLNNARVTVKGTDLTVFTDETGTFQLAAVPAGTVTLNDRPIQIKGYAQRTSNEWPAIGLSVPPWLSDYSNGLMVESGANTRNGPAAKKEKKGKKKKIIINKK